MILNAEDETLVITNLSTLIGNLEKGFRETNNYMCVDTYSCLAH